MKTLMLALVLVVSCAKATYSQSNQSVYTSLNVPPCRTLKADSSGAGSYEARCPGIGGYHLLMEEGDLRDNLVVVTAQGKEHSLNLWSVISPAFSSIGKKVEWRVKRVGSKSVPLALIVRFNASEDSEHPDKITSYLAVAKITQGEICVTNKIPPGAQANELARMAADRAASMPCLRER